MKHKVIPTAKEIASIVQADASYEQLIDPIVFASIVAVVFAKLHVTAALKEALEEVPFGGSDSVSYEDVIGILTCYPFDNIK